MAPEQWTEASIVAGNLDGKIFKSQTAQTNTHNSLWRNGSGAGEIKTNGQLGMTRFFITDSSNTHTCERLTNFRHLTVSTGLCRITDARGVRIHAKDLVQKIRDFNPHLAVLVRKIRERHHVRQW